MSGTALRAVDIDYLVKCPKQWGNPAGSGRVSPTDGRHWREWPVHSLDARHAFALFVQLHPSCPTRFLAGLSWRAGPGAEWLLLRVDGMDSASGLRPLHRPGLAEATHVIRMLPQHAGQPVRRALTPAAALREVARVAAVDTHRGRDRRAPRFDPSGLMM